MGWLLAISRVGPDQAVLIGPEIDRPDPAGAKLLHFC